MAYTFLSYLNGWIIEFMLWCANTFHWNTVG